jgi:hypothetical protein
MVAPGEPGVPVICCADAGTQLRARRPALASMLRLIFMTESSGRLEKDGALRRQHAYAPASSTLI